VLAAYPEGGGGYYLDVPEANVLQVLRPVVVFLLFLGLGVDLEIVSSCRQSTHELAGGDFDGLANGFVFVLQEVDVAEENLLRELVGFGDASDDGGEEARVVPVFVELEEVCFDGVYDLRQAPEFR